MKCHHPPPPIHDVLIIGAGISGLAARHSLKLTPLKTIVLEKSRGSGGRMSSRRGDGWIADLGAQFTAASNPQWRAILQAQGANLAEVWISEDSQFPRYIHREGMSRFARALMEVTSSSVGSEGVQFQAKVQELLLEEVTDEVIGTKSRVWRIRLENSSEEFLGKSVILTAPVPQALELLAKSDLKLSKQSSQRLAPLVYDPCLAAVIELEVPLTEAVPVLWKNPSPLLSGIYSQNRKGLKGDKPILVVHASPHLSRELWNADEGTVLGRIIPEIQGAVSKRSAGELRVERSALHRWRYCEPIQVDRESFARVEFSGHPPGHPPLVLAGDAFGRSSVEGAFLSGAAAGSYVAEQLKTGGSP